jgi:high affinity Mn2+ porin
VIRAWILAAIGLVCWPIMCGAQMVGPTPQPSGIPVTPEQAEQVQLEAWAVHAQGTLTWLLQPAFHSPYQGPQSLSPAANGRETVDVTLYAGVRPWTGAEIWINPEVDQGFGLSDTFGVAGYPSAEAYKLGKAEPYVVVQRGFLRQTMDLGGETEKLEPDLNQLGGTQTANRLVFTIGKYSIVDIFDTNSYAHDPRHDFLNWSIIDQGAFDCREYMGLHLRRRGRMVSELVDRQGRRVRSVAGAELGRLVARLWARAVCGRARGKAQSVGSARQA